MSGAGGGVHAGGAQGGGLLDAAPLPALEAIGLDELLARAPLLTRRDRKYLLPPADLPVVLGGLGDDVRVLEIDRRRAFAYRSVYFDTPDLHSYLGAARRRRRRFKLRVRSYLDSSEHFVEVKTRGPRGVTVKRRARYTGDHRWLTREARAYVRSVLAAEGIAAGALPFVPVLTTHYRRATLFLPATGSRMTIDTDLSWALPAGAVLRTPDRVIVETKSHRAASEADRLLWSLRHRPASVSKYGTGLAALRPDLPANRWQPVLRRHFSPLNPDQGTPI